MRKIISAVMALVMLATVLPAIPVFAEESGAEKPAYSQPESPSVTYNMNVDWKFTKASGGPYLAAASESVEKDGKRFYEVDYDDSEWEDVSVPHPINAEDTFDGNAYDSGEASLYRGFMFYRKHVIIPASDEGKKMFLEFEAVRQSVYLYVNGEIVGFYEAGVAPIGFDITDYVKPGEDNVIAVATDNLASRGNNNDTRETKPGSEPGAADGYGYQWNTQDFNEVQGGITGNVNLYAKGKIYQTLPLYNNLKTTGNYIYGSDFDIDNASATINVKAEIRNETDADADLTLQVDVVAMDGTLAYSFKQDGTAEKASDADAHFMNMIPADAYDENPADTDISTVDVSYITASAKAENMRFWSDKDPYLYTVYSILKKGDEVIDVQETVTGFRKTEYDINNGGFKINGESVYLRGYAQRSTDEWAVIGVANDWLNDYDMALIRESNSNHIRWMHVAPKPVEVRSSDKYGVVVVCPAGDKEADQEGRSWDQRVEAMRDAMIYFRNSPSVMFWEAGNNAVSAAHMQEITDLRLALDPNGGRYAGSRTISSVDQIKAAEYVGTMLNRNASDAKNSMKSAGDKYMPILETEYARDEAPRRVWDDYSPPDYDYKNKWLNGGSKVDGYDVHDLTSEDFSVVNAGAYNEFWAGRVGGGGSELYAGAAIMVWSDSNMHNRNTYSENCRTSGKVDAVRIKKDAFYTLQAVQSIDEAKIHIVGHWNYPEYTAGDRENGNYWYEDRTLFSGSPVHWEPNGKFLQRDPTKKTVYVIGSPDVKSVKLFINDEQVGEDYKPDNNFVYAFANIDVSGASGEIKAVAYDESGIAVAEDVIVSAGEPESIRLTPMTGPDGLIADGSDVMFFDVEVVDADGNVCPLNYDRLDLSLSGNGVLLGGYNSGVGDKITTHKDYVYAECGVNRIFVRSTRDAGPVTLKVQHETLGSFEYTVNSTAFDNTVENGTGLSTTMQRSRGLGEQIIIPPPPVEAFKPLAAAVKADFGEDGNTKVVTDIDTTIYYTVTVNGTELDLKGALRARDGSAGQSVFGPIAPVLANLKGAGVIADYSITGSPKVLTFDTGEHTYTVTEDTNAIYKDGADEGTEITENAMVFEDELFVNYGAVLSYIPEVTTTKDEFTQNITITSPVYAAPGMTFSGGSVVIHPDNEIKNASLVLAAYDNGALIETSVSDVSIAANGLAAVPVPENILSGGTESKAMLWNTLNGMKPIYPAVDLVEGASGGNAETASAELYDVDDYEVFAELFADIAPLDPADCEEIVLSEAYDNDTRTDGPDGTGYLTPTAGTRVFDDMGATLLKEHRISVDFRFDDAAGTMSIKNGADTGGKWGPNFSFDGTNFRTQTASSSWQNLGEIKLGTWYRMVIEGTMATANPSASCTIYDLTDYNNPAVVQKTASLHLRQFANSSNGTADYLIVNTGISVDNLSVTSLYANSVDVTALNSEIKANENVSISAIAKRNGTAVTTPEFEWTLHDETGAELADDTVTFENGMLFTTAETQAQTVTVRATAQTKGNPYGEVAVKIKAIDTSADTFNAISVTSEKDYVRFGEPAKIDVTAEMDGSPVTPADDDIEWTVYNAAGVRKLNNVGIKVNNGVVTVREDVIPQTITVAASNISGSATARIKLDIKPGTMILDGEQGNKDTYISGNACEELVSGYDLQEGSWDGSGYYKITSSTDFVGFPSDNGDHVLYSADMKFESTGAGWTIWNGSKGKQGMQVYYNGTQLGIVQDGSKTPTYLDVDSDSWYNVQIMCATGVSPNSYAHLIIYKYVDGERVNPVDGTPGVPFVQQWIPMRNLDVSQANHMAINPTTCVDNVYCAKTTPDEIKVSVDKNTLFAGQSVQGSVTAFRQDVPFGFIGSDLIRWVVYDENNENPLGSDLIKVDVSGLLTVDALADGQTIYLRAQTLDGQLFDSVEITIQSADIFTVQTIGFNEDYTSVITLDVTKNFPYSDNVTFMVCVYDSTESTLKSVGTRRMSGKNIARSEVAQTITLNAPMPDDFNKDSDVIWVYTMTSNSENDAVIEADGTINAAFDGTTLKFAEIPEFDASAPVILMVVKPDTTTTSVTDSDIVYIKQFTGASLAELDSINVESTAAGDYIIKLAGKIDGLSEIRTGIAKK